MKASFYQSLLLTLALAGTFASATALATPTPFEETCDALAKSSRPDSERLQELFRAAWNYQMHEYPESATCAGYPGQNHRWTDLTPAAIERRRRELPAPLRVLGTIRRENLSSAEKLSYDLFQRNCEMAIASAVFPEEYLQITQMSGVQQSVATMIRIMPKVTIEDYRNVVARLEAVGVLVDQTIVLLENGLTAGITPPKVTLRDVVGQVDAQLVADPAESPIIDSLKDFPSTLPADERERCHTAAIEALRTSVLPAYKRLRVFLAERYIPHCRETTALRDLPDGAAWYALQVRLNTTTTLGPKEIHETGRAEVERIEVEMEKAIKASGFRGTRAAFFTFLHTDPRFYYDRAEDLLVGYRDICKRADPELVKLFGRLPRQPYGVLPVPAYAAKSQPAAYYEPGSTRAGRAGYFFANAYDLSSRPKWEMEALALHEAVPGHHVQLALADELADVPEFRRQAHYTAYVEGWGLYAESLGYEMGFYTDAYTRFGQLALEMWRAARLVVDTGLHALGWSRKEAIDYFLEKTGRAEHDVTVEVDRYIVWPGQALAYKIGQLKISELRRAAAGELGDRFELRAFHDEVLGQGALPLDVLESRIKAWVSQQKR